jgi:hypothetical protein
LFCLLRRLAAIVLVGSLAACAPLSGQQRAAASSLSCARAATANLEPRHIPDKLAHCLATASISRQCSVFEAYGAGVTKEVKDLLGPGDAQGGDLRADAAGVRCARASTSGTDIERCCEDFVRGSRR